MGRLFYADCSEKMLGICSGSVMTGSSECLLKKLTDEMPHSFVGWYFLCIASMNRDWRILAMELTRPWISDIGEVGQGLC